MMQRQIFDLTDTGMQVMTGANFSGRVEQWRWALVSGDTGGSIEMGLYPRAGDTGDGWLILSAGLQPQMRASFSPVDTGVATFAAGDRLKVVKTGGVGTGRLYVWVRN